MFNQKGRKKLCWFKLFISGLYFLINSDGMVLCKPVLVKRQKAIMK